MDQVTPKIRFGIAPGSSARSSEQEAKSVGPNPSIRIQGGTSARTAETEARSEVRRPYGVSMQARTGKPCTLADLMEAEAASKQGRGQQNMPLIQQSSQSSKASEERAQDSVQRASFRPLPMTDQFSAVAGDALPFEPGPAGTKEEARTPPRSPFQTLRSLFSRTPGTEKHDKKQSH